MAFWVYKIILIMWGLLILFYRLPAVFAPAWFKEKWKKEVACISKGASRLFFILYILISIMLFYILFLFIHPIFVFLSIMATGMLFGALFLSNHKLFLNFANFALNQSNNWIRTMNIIIVALALAMIYIAIYS